MQTEIISTKREHITSVLNLLEKIYEYKADVKSYNEIWTSFVEQKMFIKQLQRIVL
tara:strand:+ start:366 stop:533 length:168 start_codon:yes stop_codon:yes gene_type:complete